MNDIPTQLKKRLYAAGQAHVLAAWSNLADSERSALVRDLEAIDLDLLARLYVRRDELHTVPQDERITPLKVDSYQANDREVGEAALRRGEAAVLIVAGGQGTRLGFDHPKGMFSIGPVRGTSLFQILVENVLATQRRYGSELPLLIMTSPATHEETVGFFEQNRFFGLPRDDVSFFSQGTMPAVDIATGKLLMEAPGRLYLSPNGHGGCLLALSEKGLLNQLAKRGIRHLLYCQVDNPLTYVADPRFLGCHVRARADVSTKAIRKEGPLDKLGNLVLIDGRCGIIEYSDLPERLARMTEKDGQLRFRLGNSAIHVFDLEFLKRVVGGELSIPFHIARKKAAHVDERGQHVDPTKENALKFELFIFDVLQRAERWTVVEIERREEFYPVKNADGADSPPVVRQAMSNRAGSWLEQARVKIPRLPNGDVAVPLEIGPLFALDAEELRSKVESNIVITSATCFS